MSEWKVVADYIEIFPHPNADKMELGRVGTFQVVIGKGLYKSGDLVVFAPKRSVLPPDLRRYFVNEETGNSYLRGPNSDRVGAIRLRGEESEGVILPKEWIDHKRYEGIEINYSDPNLHEKLGIEEYIPETHSVNSRNRKAQDGDIVQKVEEAVTLDRFVRHDVEQFRIFQNEFVPGESVVVTEKIHGTQINIIKDKYDRIAVTSKGRAEKNLVLRRIPKSKLWVGRNLWKKIVNLTKIVFNLKKADVNEYWRYAEESGIINFIARPEWKGTEIQVIGEVVPVQKGFSYGFTKPKVLVFRVVFGTKDMPYGAWSHYLSWVPLLYQGPYDLEKILPLAEGKETVSMHSLHIKEGIVISPEPLRKVQGTSLLVKVLNSKYKIDQDGEEIR